MSKVTNLILAASISEDVESLIMQFAKFKLGNEPFKLVHFDDNILPKAWYGGSKYLETNLFIGAYNHLDLDSLIQFMKNEVRWEDEESVQLIVKEQLDQKFRIIDLFTSDSRYAK